LSKISMSTEIVPVTVRREATSLTPELVSQFYTMNKGAGSVDLFDNRRKKMLTKAFITWSKCAPLIQLCGELKKQLQERSSVFEAMRESYLRDVIIVKHHLDEMAPLGQ
jgi:hypothetical protein